MNYSQHIDLSKFTINNKNIPRAPTFKSKNFLDTRKAEYNGQIKPDVVYFWLNYYYYDKDVGINGIFMKRLDLVKSIELYIDNKYMDKLTIDTSNKEYEDLQFEYFKNHDMIICNKPRTLMINNKPITTNATPKSICLAVDFKSFIRDKDFDDPKIGYVVYELN